MAKDKEVDESVFLCYNKDCTQIGQWLIEQSERVIEIAKHSTIGVSDIIDSLYPRYSSHTKLMITEMCFMSWGFYSSPTKSN